MFLLITTLACGVLFCGITDSPIEKKFLKYLKVYNKEYNPGTVEYYVRLLNFKESLKRTNRLNRIRDHSKSANYGVTQFSDLSPIEFKKTVIGRVITDLDHDKHRSRNRRSLFSIFNIFHRKTLYDELKRKLKHLPQRIDWRDKNVVTAVSNQGKCGACWAYSTVETIESMVAIKTQNLQQYSVQQLVDCSIDGGNYGCDGGDTCTALNWMSRTEAKLQTAKDYPMRDDAGECRIKQPKHGIQLSSNYTCDNFTNNEAEMVKLIASHGPLVAAVDASSWQDYLGGVIQFHCQNYHNHAVQIVGYDLTGDIPYYIVRNTWGISYGNNGYLHIAIGGNLCGIAEEISALDVIIT